MSCEFISGGLVVVAVKPKTNISLGSHASALHSTDYLSLINVVFLADIGGVPQNTSVSCTGVLISP